MIYIFDIDGTIADLTHRLHFIQKSPKDWAGFFEAAGDDKPILEVINVANALAMTGHRVLYVSGRSEDIRDITVDWLIKYGLPDPFTLYMRKSKDRREDNIVKSEILDELFAKFGPPEKLGLWGGVFDDRQQVVDMHRSRGLKVFQVAKGDF
jgi:hypothetical protein